MKLESLKMGFEEYTKLEALNYSGIKEILKSPAHYQAYLKKPREPSQAMVLGDALHTALLEPQLFTHKFYTVENVEDPRADGLPKMNTKEGKAAWDIINKDSKGKLVISEAQAKDITLMIEKLYSKKTIRDLLCGGMAEQTLTGLIDGVPVKARADYIHPGKCFILDMKTTAESAKDNVFNYKVHSLGYHIQAAFYLRVANLLSSFKDFYICALETYWPFEAQVYQLDFGTLELGNHLVDKALKIYGKCLETKKWPGYDDDVKIISVPGYAFTQEGLQNESD